MPLILCVEDDTPIRRLIMDLLLADGHEVIEAGDGQAGLDAVFEHKPDLVLLDIMMPVMDGFEVLTTLREKHPKFADMPIIFLTALASREHVIAGKEIGADDYITKPIDPEMLVATVNSRLTQITRMKARKQMQLFRLYGALMDEGTVAGNDEDLEMVADGMTLTAVSVAAEGTDMDRLHRVLETMEYDLITFDSGITFLQELADLSVDLLLVGSDTGDILPHKMVRLMKAAQECHFPVLLVVPEYRVENWDAREERVEFDDVIELSCNRQDLMERIADLSASIDRSKDHLG